MTDEAFEHVKVDQFLKSADLAVTDGCTGRLRHPLDEGGKTDRAPCGCQGGAPAELVTTHTGVKAGASETQKPCYVNA